MDYIPNILVVDDNERNRNLLNKMILALGHVSTFAINGVSALYQLQTKKIDLVLLDILMPEMNGYEVLEHIQSDPHLSKIPVIMISAVDEIDSVARCIRSGAVDYLVKPFNPTLLKTRIESCLEKKRLYDSEQRLHDIEKKMFVKLEGLYKELKKNYESLLDAETSRKTMSNMIVHDLRNRLTIIKGFVELMKSVNDNKDASYNISKTLGNVETMSFMMNSILDVSKMESCKLQPNLEAIDISELINLVYDDFVPYAKEKNVELSINRVNLNKTVAIVDKQLFSRILQNLIVNGIQHTESQLKISTIANSKTVTISIDDNGLGIPEKYRAKIFDRYFQIEAGKDRKKYGMGLGLAFCKMAVEAQKGKIWVENMNGNGSSFKVKFNLKPPGSQTK